MITERAGQLQLSVSMGTHQLKGNTLLAAHATKNLPQNHESVYVKHTTAAYTPMAKQICLNVYQTFRDKGLSLEEVLT